MEKRYQVVVCGGGLAGVCSAIAGKRMGLSTCIIQDRPVFGGNASSEIRVNIGGACAFNSWARETGIINEIFLEERKRNYEYHRTTWNNGILDIVLYEFLINEGIEIYLNTSVRKAIMKSKEEIEGVYCIQLGNEKEFIIYGDYFIDATGDGIVGFTSGAEFRIGRESKYEFGEELAPVKEDMGIMGNSILFHIKDVGKPIKFTPPPWAVKFEKDDITLKTRSHNHQPGYWWIEIGWPFDTIYDNEEIKDKLLSYVFGVWDHMKNAEDHGFSSYVIDWIGMVPGKRESRRFIGDYILNENDIKKRKKFEDAIAYGGWYIDLHTPGGILSKEEPPEPTHHIEREKRIEEQDKRFVYVYQIPYRCIYSKNIKNLFFAGRNISVTHVALGTTRLMGTCAIIGQAAGTAVYLCKKYNCLPREIYEKGYYKELQQILLREGCFIPDIKNEDKNDLCLNTKISSSSTKPLKFEKFDNEIKLDIPIGQKIPLNGKVEKIKFKCSVEKDTILKFHLRSSYDLWDFTSEEDILYREIKLKKSDEEITVEINSEFEKGIYWFYFEENENVYLKTTTENLPGLSLILKPGKKWRFNWQRINLYFEIEPEIYPFKSENIISGVSRPEKWTNVWISDKRIPQWIEIEFDNEKEFNFIQFIFDSELDKEYTHFEPFYIPKSIPRDFNIYIEEKGKMNKILEIRDNTSYFCKYKFETIRSKKIRIEFLKTNGSENIMVYEVRVYKF
ncbi:MAG: FAD-dependent oxidoreductase [Candidatus Omnitrophica bacterium]|nr:FAD-dependent oxidoreductase [Candidatus Omnitrophota bacterium]MCM8803397.1 FAD-dependent oxidoreductase [Candidatus Omnitrophota bacterium]